MTSSLYKENILDHYKNPRNFKKLKKSTSNAFLNNVTCGDEMEVFLKTGNNLIEDISFDARGCAISIAAMSMLSEKVKGKKISEAKKITDEEVLKMLGMEKETPRIKCALLGIQALRKALSS